MALFLITHGDYKQFIYVLIMADINECASPGDNNCSTNATCTNTPGGFTCTCNQGYTGDGVTCMGKCSIFISQKGA